MNLEDLVDDPENALDHSPAEVDRYQGKHQPEVPWNLGGGRGAVLVMLVITMMFRAQNGGTPGARTVG